MLGTSAARRLNLFFAILRVVGTSAARRAAERPLFAILRMLGTGTTGGGDDNRRWKVSETCETICFLLYKAGFSVRIGGTVYKAL